MSHLTAVTESQRLAETWRLGVAEAASRGEGVEAAAVFTCPAGRSEAAFISSYPNAMRAALDSFVADHLLRQTCTESAGKCDAPWLLSTKPRESRAINLCRGVAVGSLAAAGIVGAAGIGLWDADGESRELIGGIVLASTLLSVRVQRTAARILTECARHTEEALRIARGLGMESAVDLWSRSGTGDGKKAASIGRLSPRERQIVVLVTEGNDDRAIGGCLQISEHTVGVHLARIFRKLGIHRRRDLVRCR